MSTTPPLRGRARRKLTQARYFWGEAHRLGPSNWEPFVACLEAAITFGRSVMDHLNREYSSNPRMKAAFRPWYRAKQATMYTGNPSTDPVLAFFGETRDLIIHETAFGVLRATSLGVTTDAVLVLPWRTRWARTTAAFRANRGFFNGLARATQELTRIKRIESCHDTPGVRS